MANGVISDVDVDTTPYDYFEVTLHYHGVSDLNVTTGLTASKDIRLFWGGEGSANVHILSNKIEISMNISGNFSVYVFGIKLKKAS